MISCTFWRSRKNLLNSPKLSCGFFSSLVLLLMFLFCFVFVCFLGGRGFCNLHNIKSLTNQEFDSFCRHGQILCMQSTPTSSPDTTSRTSTCRTWSTEPRRWKSLASRTSVDSTTWRTSSRTRHSSRSSSASARTKSSTWKAACSLIFFRYSILHKTFLTIIIINRGNQSTKLSIPGVP